MRTLLLSLVLLASWPAAAQLGCDLPVETGDGWTRATPQQVGMDAGRLCRIDRFLEQWPNQNIHAVVVARRGKLVMDRYFTGPDERWGHDLGRVSYGPEQLHDLRAITKGVVSMMVGAALGQGKFPPLDSPAIDRFPLLADLKTADNARITFRLLLTMRSGLAWNEDLPYRDPANSEAQMNESANPYRFFFTQPFASRPGETFSYNGGNTQVLALAAALAGNGRIPLYAHERLFEPLDIVFTDWVFQSVDRPDRQSHDAVAASGLRMRPRDTAKLGQILLTDGAWKGRQVLPKGWAAEMTKSHAKVSDTRSYGYHWWLGHSPHAGRQQPWIAGIGHGGQRLVVFPNLELVVMVAAGHYGDPLQNVIPTAIVEQLVLPAVKAD